MIELEFNVIEFIIKLLQILFHIGYFVIDLLLDLQILLVLKPAPVRPLEALTPSENLCKMVSKIVGAF